jgi:hypothetical protein
MFRADSSGPAILIGWYILPTVAVLVVGTVGFVLGRTDVAGLLWAGLLAAALVGWGLGRGQRLSEAHRV